MIRAQGLVHQLLEAEGEHDFEFDPKSYALSTEPPEEVLRSLGFGPAPGGWMFKRNYDRVNVFRTNVGWMIRGYSILKPDQVKSVETDDFKLRADLCKFWHVFCEWFRQGKAGTTADRQSTMEETEETGDDFEFDPKSYAMQSYTAAEDKLTAWLGPPTSPGPIPNTPEVSEWITTFKGRGYVRVKARVRIDHWPDWVQSRWTLESDKGEAWMGLPAREVVEVAVWTGDTLLAIDIFKEVQAQIAEMTHWGPVERLISEWERWMRKHDTHEWMGADAERHHPVAEAEEEFEFDPKSYALDAGRKPFGYVLRSQDREAHYPWCDPNRFSNAVGCCGNFRRHISRAKVYKRPPKGYSALDVVPVYGDPRRLGDRALVPGVTEQQEEDALDGVDPKSYALAAPACITCGSTNTSETWHRDDRGPYFGHKCNDCKQFWTGPDGRYAEYSPHPNGVHPKEYTDAWLSRKAREDADMALWKSDLKKAGIKVVETLLDDEEDELDGFHPKRYAGAWYPAHFVEIIRVMEERGWQLKGVNEEELVVVVSAAVDSFDNWQVDEAQHFLKFTVGENGLLHAEARGEAIGPDLDDDWVPTNWEFVQQPGQSVDSFAEQAENAFDEGVPGKDSHQWVS